MHIFLCVPILVGVKEIVLVRGQEVMFIRYQKLNGFEFVIIISLAWAKMKGIRWCGNNL